MTSMESSASAWSSDGIVEAVTVSRPVAGSWVATAADRVPGFCVTSSQPARPSVMPIVATMADQTRFTVVAPAYVRLGSGRGIGSRPSRGGTSGLIHENRCWQGTAPVEPRSGKGSRSGMVGTRRNPPPDVLCHRSEFSRGRVVRVGIVQRMGLLRPNACIRGDSEVEHRGPDRVVMSRRRVH
jgi:hypothetical protein